MASDPRRVGFAKQRMLFQMRSTVYLSHQLGTNVNGEPIKSPAIPLRCYIQEHDRAVIGTSTTEYVSSMTIYIEGHITITQSDILSLDDGTVLTIIRVRPGPSRDTVLYTEVNCA